MTKNNFMNSDANQKKKNKSKIRLKKLRIKNFKILDQLEFELSKPLMANDPDIFVMGSRNGLGKTSVLESCSLLFLALLSKGDTQRFPDAPVDFIDLLIRAGEKDSEIVGVFEINNKDIEIGIKIERSNSRITIEGKDKCKEILEKYAIKQLNIPDMAEKFFYSLAGFNTEPLITPPFVYFNSYRKIQEGNPELGMLVEKERYGGIVRYGDPRVRFGRRYNTPISIFKMEILKSLMGKGKLFENFDDTEAQEVVNTLDKLMEKYAKGKIDKLRPSIDNSIEFRISPIDGKPSFTFDGLSSGQKEIISTLFLIWRYTEKQPGIVLIDEPELHLNTEWQHDFINSLYDLNSDNQYIISTHSEYIFGSVDEEHRILLVS